MTLSILNLKFKNEDFEQIQRTSDVKTLKLMETKQTNQKHITTMDTGKVVGGWNARHRFDALEKHTHLNAMKISTTKSK